MSRMAKTKELIGTLEECEALSFSLLQGNGREDLPAHLQTLHSKVDDVRAELVLRDIIESNKTASVRAVVDSAVYHHRQRLDKFFEYDGSELAGRFREILIKHIVRVFENE